MYQMLAPVWPCFVTLLTSCCDTSTRAATEIPSSGLMRAGTESVLEMITGCAWRPQ